MQNSSVVSLLRTRAGLQPDDVALRYADYENDWALHVAREVTQHAVARAAKEHTQQLMSES